MYEVFLLLHSWLRWAVLLIAIVTLVLAWYGWLGKKPYARLNRQLGVLFTTALDIQVLIGLVLYFILSPVTTSAFGNFGQAMQNPTTRFFAVEHISLMILAVVIAHLGSNLARRAPLDIAKHRFGAIFYTVALVVILLGIPWGR